MRHIELLSCGSNDQQHKQARESERPLTITLLVILKRVGLCLARSIDHIGLGKRACVVTTARQPDAALRAASCERRSEAEAAMIGLDVRSDNASWQSKSTSKIRPCSHKYTSNLSVNVQSMSLLVVVIKLQ